MKQRYFVKKDTATSAPLSTSVSEVGLGTWQLGGDWGAVGDKEAEKILVSKGQPKSLFLSRNKLRKR